MSINNGITFHPALYSSNVRCLAFSQPPFSSVLFLNRYHSLSHSSLFPLVLLLSRVLLLVLSLLLFFFILRDHQAESRNEGEKRSFAVSKRLLCFSFLFFLHFVSLLSLFFFFSFSLPFFSFPPFFGCKIFFDFCQMSFCFFKRRELRSAS